MQLTCPCCHARNSIEAFTQDEACRQMFIKCGTLPPGIWSTLTAYLSLFRSESRALSWDRALKLTTSLLELQADPASLDQAMQITVESLRSKVGKPLKDHNYLKRVLESSSSSAHLADQNRPLTPASERNTSKRVQALEALSQWGGNDWLRMEIVCGLQALVVQSLKNQPAAELITMNADVWYVAMKKSLTVASVDAPRIRKGFERLFAKVQEWPAPKQLLELMPPREARVALPAPKPTEAEYQEGLVKARQLSERFE